MNRAERRHRADRAKARVARIRAERTSASWIPERIAEDPRPMAHWTIGSGYRGRKGTKYDWGFKPDIPRHRAIAEQLG